MGRCTDETCKEIDNNAILDVSPNSKEDPLTWFKVNPYPNIGQKEYFTNRFLHWQVIDILISVNVGTHGNRFSLILQQQIQLQSLKMDVQSIQRSGIKGNKFLQ